MACTLTRRTNACDSRRRGTKRACLPLRNDPPRRPVTNRTSPVRTPLRFVDGLYDGLERCARRFGVTVVGGDTVRAPQVVVDVAILGTARPAQVTL